MNVYHVRQLLRTMSIYDMSLRVVYYARVSTDKEEQKNSTRNQKAHFEEFIKGNNRWEFCGGYIDDGISGMHAEKREMFQKMIADARNGRFDLIVTKEISRFARNTLDSIRYTRELLSCGVCVWFQNDNINTIDEDSEFRLTIMAGVAQDEIRKLSSRVKFGHAQAIKNGVVLGNSMLYGYNKEKGRLTVNEEEAVMVRLIFDKYATGAWTTPKIEKLLFDMGYRNHNGGRIDRNVINHIIQNPKYKGFYVGGKVKIVDMFTKKQEFLPKEEWRMFKDDGSRVPAIVDEETWETANRFFRERSEIIKSRRTSFKDGNIFTGKLVCAEDGATYWLKQRSSRGREDNMWVCSKKIREGAHTCGSFVLHEDELKRITSRIFNDSRVNFERAAERYILLYQKYIQNIPDYTGQVKKLQSSIALTKKKMDKILEYNLNGTISDEDFARRNGEYADQVRRMENEVLALSETHPETEARDRVERIRDALGKFSGVGPEDITRDIVNRMIERIIVTPLGFRKASLEFVLKTGETRQDYYAADGAPGAKRGENPLGCSGNVLKKMIEAQEKKMSGK